MATFIESTLTGTRGRGDNFTIDTKEDNKTLRLNSRDYNQASGSSIGLQSKPNQATTSTGDVIGAEFSPRAASAVDIGSVIAVKADPTLKGTAGDVSGSIRGVEVNIDLNDGASHTRTITGDVVAYRAFLQAPSSITYSGDITVFQVATPNTRQWTHFLEVETGNSTIAVVGAGTYSTADGYLLIKVAGSVYRFPFFPAVD